MDLKAQTNLMLCLLNVAALSYFLYPGQAWHLLVLNVLALLNWGDNVRVQLFIIAGLALLASFIVMPLLDALFAVGAFGLALSVGYSITNDIGVRALYTAMSAGIVLSVLLHDNGEQGAVSSQVSLSKDIVVICFTLPNLFMGESSTSPASTTRLYLIHPFLEPAPAYSVGFVLGMFLPLQPIKKHLKFLIVTALVLTQIWLTDPFYLSMVCLMRGVFIYNPDSHHSEFYFLIGYLLVDVILPLQRLNFMFIGYLIIAILVWQDQAKKQDQPGNQPLMETQLQNLSPKTTIY